MVYNSKTYELYHKLSKDAEDKYRKILEHAADEILFKNQHPIKWTINKIANLIKKDRF